MAKVVEVFVEAVPERHGCLQLLCQGPKSIVRLEKKGSKKTVFGCKKPQVAQRKPQERKQEMK